MQLEASAGRVLAAQRAFPLLCLTCYFVDNTQGRQLLREQLPSSSFGRGISHVYYLTIPQSSYKKVTRDITATNSNRPMAAPRGVLKQTDHRGRPFS
ncbi:hypothetical protein LZ30DRAFT_711384 [Colletotrichum cereale]|nr:hypothetical protein LZ30DRAFT_711384 [Colletotrichum cereale]